MKNFFYIFIVFLLTTSSCTQKITHFDLITLERTACFGPCPIYKLSIWADGRVQYEGNNNVKIKGVEKTHISSEEIAKITEAFNSINFFALRDQYQSVEDGCKTVATDSPSVIIGIKIGDQQKTVNHYHGCLADVDPYRIYPNNLVEFENKIDEIVGTPRWIGKD
jgi:hypothetical protein